MAAANAYAPPTFLELIPEELDVRVFHHTVDSPDGPVPCWSYVTDGLRRHGQKDVVFTLRRNVREELDDFPRDPIDLFLLLYNQALDAKTVEASGYSRFARTGGFLGRHGPVGMIYTEAVPLRGVNYPDRPLASFLVTAEELDAVRAHGAYRLLSLLGFRSNHFPYPPWSERSRSGLLTAGDVQNSLLGHTAVATVRGLMARRVRHQVHVHLAKPEAARTLEQKLAQFPPSAPIVLLTDADPEAKARLVWKPGIPVETIAADNRPEATITGGFVAIIRTSKASEGVHVCEDGFAVRLRPDNWQRVRNALLAGDSLTIPAGPGGMNLVCGLVDEDVEPVRSAGGYFYQPDDVLKTRVRAEELSWFDRRVSHVVEDHFAELPPGNGEALTVFCVVRPDQKARFWLECRPDDLPAAGRSLLLRRLSALKPPAVTAPVAWASRFELWGGTGGGNYFAPMPGEWAAALPTPDTGEIPDGILDSVWGSTS